MAIAKVLLVDDDENALSGLAELLEYRGFEIKTAASVPEALKHIISDTYDVLLSDLHMPGAGDGLTVVSAMRHANPRAITLLLTAFPEMGAATHAILLQADQILVKPIGVKSLVDTINQRLASGPPGPRVVESVSTILERSAQNTIDHWFKRVQRDEKMMAVPLSYELRCAHLPQFFRDLVYRLRSAEPLGTKEVKSIIAVEHGVTRYKQGYTAAMLVEESRMLQVSIFLMLQNSLASIDFSLLLMEVMTIADEVDSQLSQAMDGYHKKSI